VDRNRIPDGIEPITAYRFWVYSITPWHASIHSFGCSEAEPCPWEGVRSGWVTASCNLEMGHEVPNEDCTCGIYALKRVPWLSMMSTASLLGRVELAGKIIEHDLGFRAERARMVELVPFEGAIGDIMRLGNRLGIPIGHPLSHPSMTIDLPDGSGVDRAPRIVGHCWTLTPWSHN
jgi:hypothetical protein